MIASGDLPDLVFTYANINRMSDSKLSYPWNELIGKYAPDFKIDQTRIAIHTMDDGNFYTVRNSFATQEEMAQNKYSIGSDGNPGIAVREDILKGSAIRRFNRSTISRRCWAWSRRSIPIWCR